MSRLFLGHTAALCVLCVALTFNRQVYPALYAVALLSLVLVWQARPLPRRVWLPLGFLLWVGTVSGELFADLPLATVMLAAYLGGLGTGVRPLPPGSPPNAGQSALLAGPMLLLLGLLSVDVVYALCTQAPRFFWNDRLALFFDHPNAMGYVAAWGVLYSLVQCSTASRRALPLWLGLSILPCAAVALGGSRGVYLGTGMGVAVILLLLYRSRVLKLLPVAVLALALAGVVLPSQQQERILSAVCAPLEDVTVRMRMPIWLAALDGFQAEPLTGHGLRSFGDHHERYVESNIEALKALTPVVEPRVANPHNLYVGLLYAYGLGGVALLLLAVAPGVLRALRTRDADAAFFLASLCFLLGAGTVDYSLHRKDGILILFLTLGLMLAAPHAPGRNTRTS